MTVCVYGSSSTRTEERFIKSAEALGKAIAKAGHKLVYGAGGAGVMGAVARGVTAGGGYIIGVVPGFLQVDGVIYDKCDELIVTEDMKERKQIMEDHADVFVIGPGGMGTCEELFQVITLKQLGRHNKPIILFNDHGFYDSMLGTFEEMVAQKMLKRASLDLITVVDTVEEIMANLTETGEAMDLDDLKYV